VLPPFWKTCVSLLLVIVYAGLSLSFLASLSSRRQRIESSARRSNGKGSCKSSGPRRGVLSHEPPYAFVISATHAAV